MRRVVRRPRRIRFVAAHARHASRARRPAVGRRPPAPTTTPASADARRAESAWRSPPTAPASTTDRRRLRNRARRRTRPWCRRATRADRFRCRSVSVSGSGACHASEPATGDEQEQIALQARIGVAGPRACTSRCANTRRPSAVHDGHRSSPAIVVTATGAPPADAVLQRDDEDVEAVAAIGGEREAVAVGRPRRLALDRATPRRVGDRLRLLAIRASSSRCDRDTTRRCACRPATTPAPARRPATCA